MQAPALDVLLELTLLFLAAHVVISAMQALIPVYWRPQLSSRVQTVQLEPLPLRQEQLLSLCVWHVMLVNILKFMGHRLPKCAWLVLQDGTVQASLQI